jgi:uncharacterized membrane protein
MTKRLRIRIAAPAIVLAVVASLPGRAAERQSQPVLETFTVPGSSATRPGGINANGTISGFSQTPNGSRGFLSDGQDFVTLHVPGAMHTQAQKINARGDVVGFYQMPGAMMPARGFQYVRETQTFHAVDYPGAAATNPWGINERGDIVGSHMSPTPRAFLLRDGQFTDIHVPGAVSSAALDINAQGDIVGRYMATPGAATSMFLRTRHGEYLPINVPGALFTGAAGLPGGINDRGEIVGLFGVMVGTVVRVRGFLLDQDGFQTIEVEGAIATVPADINDRGDVAGRFSLQPNQDRGFVIRR